MKGEEFDKEIIFLIFQYLKEHNYEETLHKLEFETASFFNLKHFEELVIDGNWDEVQKYLARFTSIDDSTESKLTFFQIRKQKYLEALSVFDWSRAGTILVEEIKCCADVRSYKELRSLMLKDDFRKHKSFKTYKDSRTARAELITVLGNIFNRNPVFRDIMNFPEMEKSELCQIVTRDKLHFLYLQLPKCGQLSKISRMVYTNRGTAILALAANGLHFIWKWPKNNANVDGMPSAKHECDLWAPSPGIVLRNMQLNTINLEDTECLPCFAVSNNDDYLLTTSGQPVSAYIIKKFKKMFDCNLSSSLNATYVAVFPTDNNIFVIGLENGDITTYYSQEHKAEVTLKGHTARVTGLTISKELNLLVSSSANAQIFVWETAMWTKQGMSTLKVPANANLCDTQVQFHQDQKQFLVIHESQLAVYQSANLICEKQWVVPTSATRIRHATFSSDGQLVYSCFLDGFVAIFCASTLQPRSWHNLAAFIPKSISGSNIEPTVIAANPKKQSQFAVGFVDGRVFIFEPIGQSRSHKPH